MDVENLASREKIGMYCPETLQNIQLFMRMIEASVSFTWSHSNNVANYAYTIATLFGLNDEQKNLIYIGALIHDIGKIEMPESILKKAGKLTSDEWTIHHEDASEGWL